jgi:DNA-binding NarL/FixJ family response regulator
MAERFIPAFGIRDEASPAPVSQVAVLTSSDGSLGAAAALLEVADLVAHKATSVGALLELIGSRDIAAVVADPELTDGWPADLAERIVAELKDAAPVVFVCRDSADAKVIEQRMAGLKAVVLQSRILTGRQLAAAIAGAAAAHCAWTHHTPSPEAR